LAYISSSTSFINFLWSTPSSLCRCWVRQSFFTTSLHVFSALSLHLTPTTSQSMHFSPIILILSWNMSIPRQPILMCHCNNVICFYSRFQLTIYIKLFVTLTPHIHKIIHLILSFLLGINLQKFCPQKLLPNNSNSIQMRQIWIMNTMAKREMVYLKKVITKSTKLLTSRQLS